MDPILMVDHYTMTSPTFGAHPHAGLSAISVLFEDTVGHFHNRDSLGNDFDIQPGDLYWLNSGSGAIHDEAPRDGSKIHGLQIFVNLPTRLRYQDPSSLLVKKDSMPVLRGEGYQVKLALGESNGYQGINSPVWPFTVLDGFVTRDSSFGHQVPIHFNCWLYSVEGQLEYLVHDNWYRLEQGDSVAFTELNGAEIKVRGTSPTNSHFVILSGEVIEESFIQYGPFVMSTNKEIDEVIERYQLGELGSL
ncbi:pirin family protein [Vibrio hangzhouensis]|nr:pirin-like C-terminal cupin domain-containing protein [Vibrio hangzhouensis]